MALHIGKLIKEELYRQEMPVSVFAKRIKRSRNSVYDLFERQSIDMELLSKISAVLKHDFLAVYDKQKFKLLKEMPDLTASDEDYTQQLLELFEQKIRLMELEFQLLKKELAVIKTAHK